MRSLHRTLAAALAALMLLNSVSVVNACGPEYTTPVFVFNTSPDLPFKEFTNGKIGIVRSTFGRKTLVIAYRYLNGGSFTDEEQNDLIAALKGRAPEDEGHDAVKAWIDARTEFVKAEETLPPIYTERRDGGYNFFPNCTKNAFEVAVETLKNRAATYGAEDKNVSAWLSAQDAVFQNCSSGNQIPAEVGPESPAWLRKDRDYQIAAAFFYSLKFDEARTRFERIAVDYDSPWQQIAPYLVGRTFVRQASLEENATKKRELYEQAELHLQSVRASGGKYGPPAAKLLALVKYHLRPEERVVELGRALANGAAENLRQDLIDYVWLVDKFEAQVLKAEAERKKKLNPGEDKKDPSEWIPSALDGARLNQIERGELIELVYYPRKPDGMPDVANVARIAFKPDVSETEILREFELKLNRLLTPEDIKGIKQAHEQSLVQRAARLSPNTRWGQEGMTRYEGSDWLDHTPALDLFPQFLHADDLSDWILTLETEGARAYRHALAKWRQTDSPAWMITALIKAEKSSPRLGELMRAVEKVSPTDRGYATAVYHLIRLKTALGKVDEARRLLDEVIASHSDVFPVSAQNQFLEQRARLAAGLSDFLKSVQRKPVAFYRRGAIRKLSDLFKMEKNRWDPEYYGKNKEEYEQELEEEYKELLPWDDRVAFDDVTAEIFNRHFSLQLLLEAARNPNVPEYLKRTLFLAAWTRGIVLKNDRLGVEIAPEVLRLAPEMSHVFVPYIQARNMTERRHAALYVLLKSPGLSPFLTSAVATVPTSEKVEYYFGDAWWCPLPETDYTDEGKEISKMVRKPGFLTTAQLDAARRERVAFAALGDAKRYLGGRVLDWARSAPTDPRLPEALFIAVKANERYKYGCDGWSEDEKIRDKAKKILLARYRESPWTAKLMESENEN